ncbi:protein BIC1 [Sesamum alatum]|uniref:Protein BIC1 n=1 Tax=Sesamum alatum TaxID=300844 RepID=A0AAE1YMJ9_9LAMI|nr:protein BIC1 [Sesamum alatum]
MPPPPKDPETDEIPPQPTKPAHQPGSDNPLLEKTEEEEEGSAQEPSHEVVLRQPTTPAAHEEDQGTRSTTTAAATVVEEMNSSSSGRERLKRHRVEVAGRVWIPEMWGQEELLKDWIDCTAFDATLRNSSIMSARASLVEEGRRPNSTTTTTTLRLENSCSS